VYLFLTLYLVIFFIFFCDNFVVHLNEQRKGAPTLENHSGSWRLSNELACALAAARTGVKVAFYNIV
tara:strand:+ start:322 stop:522 length:201 start_codon:yes stop_codon:yes gene_type:complete